MSDSDDSDYGDVDFVSGASSYVTSHWSSAGIELQSLVPEPSTSKTAMGNGAAVPPKQTCRGTTRVGGGGKENVANVAFDSGDDSDEHSVCLTANDSLNLTPPGSPNCAQGMPTTGGKRPRAVRGAKRTRKTEQALKRILVSGHQEQVEQDEPKLAKRRCRLPENDSAVFYSPVPVSICKGEHDKSDNGGDVFSVKVRFRGEIHRMTVTSVEKMGTIADRLGASLDLPAGRVSLELDGERLVRERTVASAGLSIASILQARTVEDEEEGDEGDYVCLKVQNKERRGAILVKMKGHEKMSILVDRYCAQKHLDRNTLKFYFDGEPLDLDETPETLDLEGGECIDVHLQQ